MFSAFKSVFFLSSRVFSGEICAQIVPLGAFLGKIFIHVTCPRRFRAEFLLMLHRPARFGAIFVAAHGGEVSRIFVGEKMKTIEKTLKRNTSKPLSLSIVVPCFNEEEAIPFFYEETNKILCKLKDGSVAKIESFEFVFVDDGSSDKTLDVLRRISKKDEAVHYISFSRNFGKESALFAGLSKSGGEYVAVMDADLQDPPSLLPSMLSAIQDEGYDCAATRRITRKNEPPVRSFFARQFYKIMGWMSDVPVVDGARDFRLMTRQYKNAVLSLLERNRFAKGIFPWVGFRTKWFAYENAERVAGKTKWSFWKLFLYSLDGIIGFSTKPLVFSATAGVLAVFVSLALILVLVFRRIAFGDPVQGWASLVCIITFFSGLQLTALGISGLYVSKIYTEVKQRPLYIVKEDK